MSNIGKIFDKKKKRMLWDGNVKPLDDVMRLLLQWLILSGARRFDAGKTGKTGCSEC